MQKTPIYNTKFYLNLLSSVNKICGIPNGQRINGSCLSHPFMLQYLALIARLTSNFLKKSPKKNTHRSMYNEPAGYEGDSDSDSEEPQAVNRETTVNTECIQMMNDNNSCVLQACTNAGQNDWTGEALEQISAISHHLLLSHKMAVHIYKYGCHFSSKYIHRIVLIRMCMFCAGYCTHWLSNHGFCERYGTGLSIWSLVEEGILLSLSVEVVHFWRLFPKVWALERGVCCRRWLRFAHCIHFCLRLFMMKSLLIVI